MRDKLSNSVAGRLGFVKPDDETTTHTPPDRDPNYGAGRLGVVPVAGETDQIPEPPDRPSVEHPPADPSAQGPDTAPAEADDRAAAPAPEAPPQPEPTSESKDDAMEAVDQPVGEPHPAHPAHPAPVPPEPERPLGTEVITPAPRAVQPPPAAAPKYRTEPSSRTPKRRRRRSRRKGTFRLPETTLRILKAYSRFARQPQCKLVAEAIEKHLDAEIQTLQVDQLATLEQTLMSIGKTKQRRQADKEQNDDNTSQDD